MPGRAVSVGFCLVSVCLARTSRAGEEGDASRSGLMVNGKNQSAQQRRNLEKLELALGLRFPSRSYWYDKRSGAFGFWGGPAGAILPAGLDLGPAMPSNCSGGGTGVFVNGRELHPLDVLALQQITVVLPGRYWLNSQGIGGLEGGPPSFNLLALAAQARTRNSPSGGPWTQRLSGGGYVSGDGKSSVMLKDATGHTVLVGP